MILGHNEHKYFIQNMKTGLLFQIIAVAKNCLGNIANTSFRLAEIRWI
jgi:hypothetical protein